MYHLMNMNRESYLGHNPGYMIDANNAAAYGPFDMVNDPSMKRNADIGHTFWTTSYAVDERYAGGRFAMASDGNDTPATWVEQDRQIVSTDIVTWLSMGFHHIPADGGLAGGVLDVQGHPHPTVQLLRPQPGGDDPAGQVACSLAAAAGLVHTRLRTPGIYASGASSGAPALSVFAWAHTPENN